MDNPSSQTCEPTLIHRLYDGELNAMDRARVSAHLDGCPSCRCLYHDLESLSRVLAPVGEGDMPAGWVDQFTQQARDLQLQRSRRIAWGLMAAASLMLAGSLFLVRYSQAAAADPPPAITAQWEEDVVVAPTLDEEFVDLEERTLVAIHIQERGWRENGHD